MEGVDLLEEKIPSLCEGGEWIDFPQDQNNSEDLFSAVKILKYEKEGGAIKDENNEYHFQTAMDYSLDYFVARKVEIEGFFTNHIGGKEVYVNRIRCVGDESDKRIVEKRQKIMKYVADNINTLAPEFREKNDWRVTAFYFVNQTDFYAEYESLESFEEGGSFDAKLWLIRVIEADNEEDLKIETLAYIYEDEENPEENIIKSGQDLHRNVENMIVYEYDEEWDRWTLQ